jgi:hypothetical protein
VTWRSLDYASRVWAYDLAPLPSEISTLGCFQEDMEEYPGVYIVEDMMEDIWYVEYVVEGVMEDVVEADRSNRDTIVGLQEHGGRPHRPIDRLLWDIPINIPGTFVYHIYPYDPESFQSHIPLYYPQR